MLKLTPEPFPSAFQCIPTIHMSWRVPSVCESRLIQTWKRWGDFLREHWFEGFTSASVAFWLFLLWTTKLVVDRSYRDLRRFVGEISHHFSPDEALNSLHNVSQLWSRSCWSIGTGSVNKNSKAATTETRSLRRKTCCLNEIEKLTEMWSRDGADFAIEWVPGGHFYPENATSKTSSSCRCFALVLECLPTRYVANLAALEQCTSQN